VTRSPLFIHIAMLLVTMIWGANFVAMKYLIDDIGSFHVALIRIGFAALVFGLVLLVRRRAIPRFPRSVWGLLLLVGLFGIVTNQLGISFGTGFLSAGVASMIATSTPIFTALISRLMLGEPLTRRKLFGISLSFCGFLIVLLYGSGAAEFSIESALGLLLGICGPISWSIATVLSKPLMAAYDATMLTAVTTVIGGLLIVPLLLTQPGLAGELAGFGWQSWLAVFVASFLSVVVAYTIWYRALRTLEPAQLAIYVYLVPVFGILFAAFVLGEAVTIFLLLGGATILAGVVIVNSGRRAAKSTPADQSRLGGYVSVLLERESHIGK
jgi:drug/metabolite transporter (DMT)-like permease